MASKTLEELFRKLRKTAGPQDDIEPLSSDQAEEVQGGSIDFVCENMGCNGGCPQENSSCTPR